MVRIDFFGGSYGHYLEYLINRYIFNISSAKEFTPFDKNGASHIKSEEYRKQRKVIADHYSFDFSEEKVNQNDEVIQVLVHEDSYYHVYYNLEVRAGIVDGTLCMDLFTPEKDCLAKLGHLIEHSPTLTKPKFAGLRDQIIKDFGIQKDYPRNFIRNYFYSRLYDKKFTQITSIDSFSDYNGIHHKRIFWPVDSVMEFDNFLIELRNIADWLELPFTPDASLQDIYNRFIEKNQGLHSYKKCSIIINNIIQGLDYEFSVNILEEAWINCNITKKFQIYDGIDCFGDVYPTNTKVIHDQIMNKLK
jgi:hypothetical protein